MKEYADLFPHKVWYPKYAGDFEHQIRIDDDGNRIVTYGNIKNGDRILKCPTPDECCKDEPA
jgi:hypothetical protein